VAFSQSKLPKIMSTANDIIKMGNYLIHPIINGLSDHNAQSITLYTFNLSPSTKKYKLIRNINEHTMNDFLIKLSFETWDTMFYTDDVNYMFNSFLDSYLKFFIPVFH
jgi:hypothetical protein